MTKKDFSKNVYSIKPTGNEVEGEIDTPEYASYGFPPGYIDKFIIQNKFIFYPAFIFSPAWWDETDLWGRYYTSTIFVY